MARFRPHQGRFLPECFEGMVGGHFLALDPQSVIWPHELQEAFSDLPPDLGARWARTPFILFILLLVSMSGGTSPL